MLLSSIDPFVSVFCIYISGMFVKFYGFSFYACFCDSPRSEVEGLEGRERERGEGTRGDEGNGGVGGEGRRRREN